MTIHGSMAFTAALMAVASCTSRPAPEAPPATSSEALSAADAAPVAGAAPASEAGSAAAGAPRPGCTESFAAFDANADQRVSLQEFLARPHASPDPDAIFHSRDGDQDGSLTAEEFCSGWRPARGGMGPGMGPGRRHGMGPGAGQGMGPGAGQGMGPGGGGQRCEAQFARFDVNADGKVTEAEFAALPHPHGDAHAIFAARDQDHDGLLSVSELCVASGAPRPAPAP